MFSDILWESFWSEIDKIAHAAEENPTVTESPSEEEGEKPKEEEEEEKAKLLTSSPDPGLRKNVFKKKSRKKKIFKGENKL